MRIVHLWCKVKSTYLLFSPIRVTLMLGLTKQLIFTHTGHLDAGPNQTYILYIFIINFYCLYSKLPNKFILYQKLWYILKSTDHWFQNILYQNKSSWPLFSVLIIFMYLFNLFLRVHNSVLHNISFLGKAHYTILYCISLHI